VAGLTLVVPPVHLVLLWIILVLHLFVYLHLVLRVNLTTTELVPTVLVPLETSLRLIVLVIPLPITLPVHFALHVLLESSYLTVVLK
jgi:hypothetical protein